MRCEWGHFAPRRAAPRRGREDGPPYRRLRLAESLRANGAMDSGGEPAHSSIRTWIISISGRAERFSVIACRRTAAASVMSRGRRE